MPEVTNLAVNIASLIISGEKPLLAGASPGGREPQLGKAEVIGGYIVAYYYAAMTNVFCQAHLIPAEQPGDNDMLQGIVDASYQHFHALDRWFATLDPNELETSPNARLFHEAREGWKPLVTDWAAVSRRSQRAG